MITIQMSELEKALGWLRANSNRLTINIYVDGPKLTIKTTDKLDQDVELVLFDTETALMPKIRKTDVLR